VVGTLAGLFGLFMLLLPILLILLVPKELASCLVLIPLALPVSGFCLWVAYLVWFRFSPLAVRHVCYLIGFSPYFTVMNRFQTPAELHAHPWLPVVFLAGLAGIYYLCRMIGNYLSLFIFPEPVTNNE